MKKVFAFVLISLLSCGKSNLWVPPGYPEITETWVVEEGHDLTFYSAPFFCLPQYYLGIDTVQLKYTKAPTDPYQYGFFVRDIYVDSYIFIDSNLYDRHYKLLLKKLNL